MQTSFGSNEKTSEETLRDIMQAFGGPIKEQKDGNTIAVNIGYKDALEYAKGNNDFSPEKTKSRMDKIATVLSNNGKKASFTPVAKAVDLPDGVDKTKFDSFIKDLNSHIKTKQYSTMTASGPQISSKQVSDSAENLTSKDELIVIGDSNSRPLAKRWYGVGAGGSIEGENKALVFHMHKGKLVAPSIGSAMVSKIYEYVQKFFAQKGENYKPKVAILHMGYNGVRYSLDPYKKTIDFLKSKGVSDIRVIELKIDPKKQPKMAQQAKVLNDQLRQIPGIKFIANPGINGSDGYHFTNYGAIYSAAMSGVTASDDIQQSSGISTASQPVRRTPTLRQNMESFGAPLDPRVEKLYYAFGKKAIGYEPNQFDLHARGITDLETANNSKRYIFVNSAGYIGKYQLNGDWWYTTLLSRIRKDHGLEDLIPEGDIGYAEPEKGRHKPQSWVKKGENKYGKRLSYKQFAKEIVKKDMWQIQELLWAAMQAENSGASKGMDQRTKAGYLAISHNIGGPTADIWVKAKKDYLKTKDPRYLMKMWSMQDGNHTAGERFLRNSARKVYGAKFIKLPQGKHSVFAEIYARETGKPKPRFQSKFGNSFNPNSKLEVYEEYWNGSTGNADIFKYYKKDGSPAGDAGSLAAASAGDFGGPSGTTDSFGSTSVATAGGAGVGVSKVNIEKEKERKEASRKEGTQAIIKSISEAKDYEAFISAFYDAFSMDSTSARLALNNIKSAESRLTDQDLSNFAKQRIEFLKSQHKLYSSKWKKEYREAGCDGSKPCPEEIEKKIAFFHRPIFFVSAFTGKLRKFFDSGNVTFGFEPNLKRVSVNRDGKQVFYKQDFSGNKSFNKFMEDLERISQVGEAISKKVADLSRSEPDRKEDLQHINKYITSFNKIVNQVSSVLTSSSESAIRKAYSITALDLAFRSVR